LRGIANHGSILTTASRIALSMQALFSELKSELLVAHSIPDKLKLFEEIGTAGEHSVPIKKLFFESGVFSRLLDEMRLTKLKQVKSSLDYQTRVIILPLQAVIRALGSLYKEAQELVSQ
jgi:hypothetical protein